MLDDFILSNRDRIVSQARARVASRTRLKPPDVELMRGIPAFLQQLGDALRLAKSSDVIDHAQIGRSAAEHGESMLRRGLTVDQVVHDYGDVCQIVSELTIEQNVTISGKEFKVLNLCLDDAIAGAVTAYSRRREYEIRGHAQSRGTERIRGTERLGTLAHEWRSSLDTVTLAFESIRKGKVAIGGSTGNVLVRGLLGLRSLLDESLADLRLDAGLGRLERVSVAKCLEEARVGGALQAWSRDLQLVVHQVDGAVTIEGDRESLIAALSNLLQNALQLTRPGTTVTLATEVTADRVLFHIEDECGGLSGDGSEAVFRPSRQGGGDHRGVGLGLAICAKVAKANGGEVRLRDLPGRGCILTLDLPRNASVLARA